MKLCRFARSDNSVGWGLASEYGIQDISIGDPTLPNDMVELIQRWDQLLPRIQGLAKRLGPSEEELRLLCPLNRPGKILCIGLNYRDHAIETGQSIPEEPIVFSKMPTAMIGPGDPIVLPKVSKQVDFEAELVIVMGEKVRHATEEEAKKSIFGYTVGHDVSARDWQTGKPGRQWFLGKSFDSFAPVGPYIALASIVPQPDQLQIQCRINGEIMQDGSTNQLIFSPTAIVSYISQVMTLEPGDVIFTGTPLESELLANLHDSLKMETSWKLKSNRWVLLAIHASRNSDLQFRSIKFVRLFFRAAQSNPMNACLRIPLGFDCLGNLVNQISTIATTFLSFTRMDCLVARQPWRFRLSLPARHQ